MIHPLDIIKSSNVDAVLLDRIHKRLILCSAKGSQMLVGNQFANITVASKETSRFLITHPSYYRAAVWVNDTHNISYRDFVTIFEIASDLLHNALSNKKNLYTALSCYAGINRSTTTVLMYCIRQGLDFDRCLQYIRFKNRAERGLPALTNTTFERYLRRYNKELKSF
tara:strand:+ start:3847 stop:4350 length:504 start_codon:yes stop_codon:yes gene_type:complete